MDKRVIRELYAYVGCDDKGEGIAAVHLGDGGYLPLVSGELKKMDDMKETARRVARETGETVYLKRFSNVEVLGWVEP